MTDLGPMNPLWMSRTRRRRRRRKNVQCRQRLNYALHFGLQVVRAGGGYVTPCDYDHMGGGCNVWKTEWLCNVHDQVHSISVSFTRNPRDCDIVAWDVNGQRAICME
jgi:hypothetical protein